MLFIAAWFFEKNNKSFENVSVNFKLYDVKKREREWMSEPRLVWLSGLSAGLQTKRSLVWFPLRAYAWVAGQVPSRRHVRDNHTLMFLSLSFSLPCPLKISVKKNLWYIYTMEYCAAEREGTPTLQDSMDGTGEHYAKWNKLGGERQIPYDLTCKWNTINKTRKI